MNKLFSENVAGFTLLELLVVIGIIAVLAAAVIVAINPARQFAQANNAQRQVDVNTILNSIGQYMVDNKGSLPPSMTSAVTTIGTGQFVEVCKTGAVSCTALIDLSTDLVPTYVVSMPNDPTGASTNGSGYQVATTTANRIKVKASSAQLNTTIEVSR